MTDKPSDVQYRLWAPTVGAMAATLAVGLYLQRQAGVGWRDEAAAPVAAAGLVLAFTFAGRLDRSWRLASQLVLGFTLIQLVGLATTREPAGELVGGLLSIGSALPPLVALRVITRPTAVARHPIGGWRSGPRGCHDAAHDVT